MERDQAALDFIETFKIATSKQIADMVYGNLDTANRRLKKFTDDKLLYRLYNPIRMGYLYAPAPIRSTKQLKHKLLRNEVYFELLRRGVEVTNVLVEPMMGSIRPDMMIQFTYNDENYAYFVEIETACNVIDTNKYNNWFISEYKNYITTPIPVIYVTQKCIKGARYEYLKVSLDLSDIEKLIGEQV